MIVNGTAFFNLPLSPRRFPENILNLTFVLHVYTTDLLKSFLVSMAYDRQEILRKR